MNLIERINHMFLQKQGRRLIDPKDPRDGYAIMMGVVQEVFDDQQRQIDDLKKTLAALGVRT